MRINRYPDRTKLVEAAQRRIPCDLLIRDIKLVNVLTGEIYPAFVEILDGVIVYTGTMDDEPNESGLVIDGKGRYLLPGFIDIHMHVESSMMLPEYFGRQAVTAGTTAVFVDPHEIGNVFGTDGIHFMISHAKGSPVRQFNLIQPCIPADSEFVHGPYTMTEDEVRPLLEEEGVLGIAEVMDHKAVLGNDSRLAAVLRLGLEQDCIIQGHAPGVTGRQTAAYRLGGPANTHTARSLKEVEDALRLGLRVNLQSSSLVDSSLRTSLEGLRGKRYTDLVCVCTDDVHAKDLYYRGHINAVLRQLIKYGVDPVEAIRWATINAARDAGITDIGAIAPGYAADLQLVDELDGRTPAAVFVGGQLMAENGLYVGEDRNEPTVHERFLNSIRISADLKEKDLVFTAFGEMCTLPVVNAYGRKRADFTWQMEEFIPDGGYLSIEKDNDLCYVCVVNRFGELRYAKGLYRGLRLADGAMAASVSHDSHHVVVAYKKASDAMAALRWMEKSGGGFCCVQDGRVTGELPLPVAGLMTTLPCGELVKQLDAFQDFMREIFDEKDPEILKLSLLSLTVLPGVAITDEGLIDCAKRQWISLETGTGRQSADERNARN